MLPYIILFSAQMAFLYSYALGLSKRTVLLPAHKAPFSSWAQQENAYCLIPQGTWF